MVKRSPLIGCRMRNEKGPNEKETDAQAISEEFCQMHVLTSLAIRLFLLDQGQN